MPDIMISIIIRTFNEEMYLERTISSILNQDIKSIEIIFVDSGSTDNTLRIINKYMKLRYVPMKLLKISASNFTYGKAINLGIKASSNAKYIAILSAHSIPCDNKWLANLVKPLEEDKKIAGVYGKQTVLPEHKSHKIEKILCSTAYKDLYKDYSFLTNRSCFFSNANSAINIDNWKTNKFDEHLPNAEDCLWAKREIKRGFNIYYQSDATVYHSHADSYKRHYTRMKNQYKAFWLINSKRYPRLSMYDLVKLICINANRLISEIISDPENYRYHRDLFFFKTVNDMAMYAGRRV